MRLFLFLASALLLAGAGVVAALFLRDSAPDRVVDAELAGTHLVFPQQLARDPATASGGMADRLSFVAAFPDFTPLAPRERAQPMAVVVTLAPKDDGPDPAERPANLYAHFLTEETSAGPGGLILRRFEANSPYDLEQLYVAPDNRSFFARCPKPQGGAIVSDACLSVFRQGAIDVELRYAPVLLEHWDGLYDGARAMIARMTARPRKHAR